MSEAEPTEYELNQEQPELEIEDATQVDAPETAAHAYDVLAAALAGKPADAQAAFNDMMLDRVADFVATRREEMSTQVFGDPREQPDMFGTDDELLDEPAEPTDQEEKEQPAEDATGDEEDSTGTE